MNKTFSGSKPNSNVTRFITSGKPGGCFLCEKWFARVEAHHLSYSPEITVNLCHLCHHTVHFWPTRLSPAQKLKLLRARLPEAKAWIELSRCDKNIRELAKLIAPSRSKFVRSQQKLEIKRLKKPKNG